MPEEQIREVFARLAKQHESEIKQIFKAAIEAGCGKSRFAASIAAAHLLLHSIRATHSKAPQHLQSCVSTGQYAREILDWVIDVFDEIDAENRERN